MEDVQRQLFNQALGSLQEAASQSFTRTRTKRTTEIKGGVGGNDQEFSQSAWAKFRKGPKRAKDRPFPTNTIIDQNSGVLEGGAGRLHAATLSSSLQTDMQRMLVKLYAQNPASFGARVNAGPVPSIANTAVELYHVSTEQLITLKNFHSVGVRVRIYEVHPKRNSPDYPLSAWVEGLKETQGHDATLAADLGIVSTPVGSQWGQAIFPVGTKPEDSEEFKSLWEIDFQREIYLGPSDQHEHRSMYAPHKLIKASEFYEAATGDGTALAVIHDHSRYIMIAAHGALALASIAGAGVSVSTVNDVAVNEIHWMTTSPIQIGWTAQIKYRYSMLDFSPGGDIDVVGSLFSKTATKDREADGDEVVPDPTTG